MRVWANLGLVFALARMGFTPGQLSRLTRVLSEHARSISAEGVPSGLRVLVAEAPRILKPFLMACTPFWSVPDELSPMRLMPSP